LTEDISFVIGTTLVRVYGLEEVQSSGIESNRGERLDIISLWCKAAIKNALAKVNEGNDNQGPVLKVRDRVDQSIIGLVSQPWQAKNHWEEGESIITK